MIQHAGKGRSLVQKLRVHVILIYTGIPVSQNIAVLHVLFLPILFYIIIIIQLQQNINSFTYSTQMKRLCMLINLVRWHVYHMKPIYPKEQSKTSTRQCNLKTSDVYVTYSKVHYLTTCMKCTNVMGHRHFVTQVLPIKKPLKYKYNIFPNVMIPNSVAQIGLQLKLLFCK